MVERVEFDASVPAQPMHKRWKSSKPATEDAEEQRGKKRKRNNNDDDAAVIAEGVVEDADSALPRLWDREVRRSGSSAVVTFVDGKSARGALRAVQRAVKEGKGVVVVVWKSKGEGLGVERKSSSSSSSLSPCLCICVYMATFRKRRREKERKNQKTNALLFLAHEFRLQIPPRTHTSIPHPPPSLAKRLPHPIQRPRNTAQQTPQDIPLRPR